MESNLKEVHKVIYFSLCIPVYKNVKYLERLLQSIWDQTFKDYEVIISDDSPDISIKEWVYSKFPGKEFLYFKNSLPLGTPANWNHAISKAKGEWIKIMHDDDWFASSDALFELHQALKGRKERFAYCNYENRFVSDITKSFCKLSVSGFRKYLMFLNPVSLYGRNIIGPPSVVCVHRTILEEYDYKLKWLVDIDYYIRVLKHSKAVYIGSLLVYVGVGEEQVTQYTHNVPAVEISEGMQLLSKIGLRSFNNFFYYDAWWRLIRNMGIRDQKDIVKFAQSEIVPLPVSIIIRHQKLTSTKYLHFGVVSKIFMVLSWLNQKINGSF
jgi:glycosyltransferase involved in cell wall biosynthesis